MYTVKIQLSKINEETGKQELGASFEANQLDFAQAKQTIEDSVPALDALRNDWLKKDVE